MAPYYFSLPESELEIIELSLFEKCLLSRIVHTLRLGVYMYQKRSDKAEVINKALPGAVDCEAYIKSAFSSEVLSDKLFPLRHTGSSMQFILKSMPIPSNPFELSAINIFQLCIWRTFAFGTCDRLAAIELEDEVEGDDGPDLDHLCAIIRGSGNGALKLAVPAYGQLQILKAKVPSMLSSFWELAQDISASITAKMAPPTFANLHNLLIAKSISSVPQYGLIPWLLISDFFEYGLCQPPTLHDLAEHMTNGKAAGPCNAIKIIALETGEVAPADADELANVLGAIFEVLQKPPKKCPTIEKLAEDCKAIQGRVLSVVDLEHALCKISRQNSRVMAGNWPKKTAVVVGKSAKGKKRGAEEREGGDKAPGVADEASSGRDGNFGDGEEGMERGQVDGVDDVVEPAAKKRKTDAAGG
ncbi:hypothetical protein VTL71DRAFT_9184 [Oculimacula yallundae]|uniref:Uncharacterized protein n=1 Tax=Oculimacula yallundae TaxID=86028 RepID=A0ABR4BSD9_9HELO